MVVPSAACLASGAVVGRYFSYEIEDTRFFRGMLVLRVISARSANARYFRCVAVMLNSPNASKIIPGSCLFALREIDWLGDQDSNLDKVLQRHLTYH